jgi:O-acetyl-ADP-ribose deacetylase (regulator of RNase III)
MWWRSSERSIRDSVGSAIGVAKREGYGSVALPLIGAGTGGGSEDEVVRIIEDQLRSMEWDGDVVIVRFRRK